MDLELFLLYRDILKYKKTIVGMDHFGDYTHIYPMEGWSYVLRPCNETVSFARNYG